MSLEAWELSAAAELERGSVWQGLAGMSVMDARCPQTTSHEPPSPQPCSALASSVVRAGAAGWEQFKIFAPAGPRWSPGHGQPCYCSFKATDMPGILETKPNQNHPLKICFKSWGFSRGLHGSKERSGTPGSVTRGNRKLKPRRILSSAESICSYNKAVYF